MIGLIKKMMIVVKLIEVILSMIFIIPRSRNHPILENPSDLYLVFSNKHPSSVRPPIHPLSSVLHPSENSIPFSLFSILLPLSKIHPPTLPDFNSYSFPFPSPPLPYVKPPIVELHFPQSVPHTFLEASNKRRPVSEMKIPSRPALDILVVVPLIQVLVPILLNTESFPFSFHPIPHKTTPFIPEDSHPFPQPQMKLSHIDVPSDGLFPLSFEHPRFEIPEVRVLLVFRPHAPES